MSDNNSSYSASVSDSISIVEMFATVIRYRTMIIVGTVVCTLLAVTYYTLLPALGFESGRVEDAYVATMDFDIVTLPENLTDKMRLDVMDIVVPILTNPVVVGEAYSITTGDSGDATTAEYQTMIKRDVIGHALNTSVDRTNRILTIRYRDTDERRASQFVHNLALSLNELVQTRVTRDLDTVENQIEHRLQEVRFQLVAVTTGKDQTSNNIIGALRTQELEHYLKQRATVDSMVTALQEDVTLMATVQSFGGLPCYLCAIVDSAELSVERSGTATVRVIIVAVTAFFLFVLLAFFRRYIAEILLDPLQRKKLSDAWNRL